MKLKQHNTLFNYGFLLFLFFIILFSGLKYQYFNVYQYKVKLLCDLQISKNSVFLNKKCLMLNIFILI